MTDQALFGVDICEFQNGLDLHRAAVTEGIAFAIIRTTDGTYKDHVYTSHLLDAEGAGLVTAAYHYLRAPREGSTVAQQVQASVEVMGEHKRPVWIDVETEAGLHVEDIRACKREFEARGVRVIGCYSYVPYWEGRIAPGEPDSHEFGAFWVAAYGTNPRGVAPAIYPGNGHRQWSYPLGNQLPVVWQFGSRCLVGGFEVDVDAFRGSREQLRALFYGEPVAAPAEPAPPAEGVLDPAPTPPVEEKPEVVREPEEPATSENGAAPSPHGEPGGIDRPSGEAKQRRTVMDVLLEAIVSLIVGPKPGKEK